MCVLCDVIHIENYIKFSEFFNDIIIFNGLNTFSPFSPNTWKCLVEFFNFFLLFFYWLSLLFSGFQIWSVNSSKLLWSSIKICAQNSELRKCESNLMTIRMTHPYCSSFTSFSSCFDLCVCACVTTWKGEMNWYVVPQNLQKHIREQKLWAFHLKSIELLDKIATYSLIF